MDEIIKLYHSGYSEIRYPDVQYGRKNADLGQGFYTTDDADFARGWAHERKDSSVIVNEYILDLSGLSVRRFGQDGEWFSYILSNRRLKPDALEGIDVVIGPVSADTVYDTLGLFTSGILTPAQSAELLSCMPQRLQIVLKTERAAEHLTWTSSRALAPDELKAARAAAEEGRKAFEEALGEKMSKIGLV